MLKVGIVIVGVAAVAAVFGPWLVAVDPSAQTLALRLAGPTWAHPFGLDELGRDILARVVAGARISFFVGLAVVGVSASIGTTLGAGATLPDAIGEPPGDDDAIPDADGELDAAEGIADGDAAEGIADGDAAEGVADGDAAGVGAGLPCASTPTPVARSMATVIGRTRERLPSLLITHLPKRGTTESGRVPAPR